MMPVYHWTHNFTVSDDDLDYISGLLLEGEIPLSTEALTRALIDRRLEEEAAALEARYHDVQLYNPAQSYDLDQKVMFPALNYRTGVVIDRRDGTNTDTYGAYSVMTIRFDDAPDQPVRKFAINMTTPHKLSDQNGDNADHAPWQTRFTAEQILEQTGEALLAKVNAALRQSTSLVSVAGMWFPRDLIIDVNEGYLNLAEAVLDIAEGRPLTPDEILDQIGGLGSANRSLQVFSLNHALNHDKRFDEVGPVNAIWWYLRRLEPAEVQSPPLMLIYNPVEYRAQDLTPEMRALEVEIDDEWSDLPDDEALVPLEETEITLNYAHRRMGTLPLNARMRRVFPTALRTPRIYVTLVDGQDQEEYVGWVLRGERFVYGLSGLYRKHKLPVGAHVTIKRDSDPSRIVIDFQAHNPRTEWIRIITPKDSNIAFEDQKRSIGANYDELMLFGADDLNAVDALFTQNHRKGVPTLVKVILTELSRSAPHSPIHGKTLYSAFNIVRRCPPGPIFAAMINNPDFEYVGNNYWKLSAD
jgi:hypothetical protein